MSRGIDGDVPRELIGIETDDIDYYMKYLKSERRKRLKAKERKYRIFRGNLIEDIRS